jgi:DnaJ-like protein
VSSILASVFGAQAILLAVGSTIFTVASIPVASKLQAGQLERKLARDQRRLQLERQQQLARQRSRVPSSTAKLPQPVQAPAPPKLDGDCAELLRRAKSAVQSILASPAHAENLLDPPVNEQLLRDNVREIAAAGHEITDLRAEHRSIISMSSSKSEETPAIGTTRVRQKPNEKRPCPTCHGTGATVGTTPRVCSVCQGTGQSARNLGSFGISEPCKACRGRGLVVDNPCPDCSGSGRASDMQPGPMTAEVIKLQQQALARVLKSTRSRVENLEHYASSVNRVEATHRDWLSAQKAERLNDRVRNLLANTARDEVAMEDLRTRTERTVVAEQAFRHSLQEANLAAETLALPDEKKH